MAEFPSPRSDCIDIDFTAAFTHRVRFTHDVLGTDQRVLIDLLHGPSPRVLVCVEAALEIEQRLTALAAAHPEIQWLNVIALSGGEPLKNDPSALMPVLRGILDGGVDRQSYVLAAGGGALLDAVGFAATLAHRGVRLIRLPSTVLSQADSGLGVKNAINFFGRKNWLGTFAVPWAVINDQSLLSTLGDGDYRAGFAEAVKVALLKDVAFFEQLCRDAAALARRDADASASAIRRSAALHLSHITRGGDPFESQQARPLDFGHWSAHRLEAMSNFSLTHGRAVAIGLAIDVAYSRIVHGLPQQREAQLRTCLDALRLPLQHPLLDDVDGLIEGIEEFRQHLGGRLTLTMLHDVGRPVEAHDVDLAAMKQAIASLSVA